MPASAPAVRVRYPLRAVAVVVLAALFFLAELALLALFMMPLVPLVPVFITFMLGQACLLASLIDYVASLARTEPVKPVGVKATSRATPPAKAVEAA
jgi:hypothetical protein